MPVRSVATWSSPSSSSSSRFRKHTPTPPPRLLADAQEMPHDVEFEDMPYVHFGHRPRYFNYVKFKSPRRRANKLLLELEQEQIAMMKQANPAVWETQFKVGDAIEIKKVGEGGVNSEKYERIRGVVLGRVNRGLSSTVHIRDVIDGVPIEWYIALFSPLVKSVTLLQSNFVFKGHKKVKRAKLYYLREKKLGICNVSKKFR